MERAENTARMLDVNYQISLLPQSGGRGRAGLARPAQHQRADRRLRQALRRVDADATSWTSWCATPTNGSSIRSCLHGGARERARGARHAHHRGLGDAEPDLARVPAHGRDQRASSETRARLFEWVKFRSHLSRGVTVGTMLQDEAFHFLRIGTFLERADNTARLLDVKFHAVDSDFFGARGRARRRRPERRLLSLVGDPALGLRLRDLPQGLSQRDPAREGGRAADPAPRHAALAGRLHERGGRQPAAGRQRAVRPTRCAAPAGCAPTCSTAASTRSWRPGCTPTSRSSSSASTTSASASAATSWCR